MLPKKASLAECALESSSKLSNSLSSSMLKSLPRIKFLKNQQHNSCLQIFV